MPALPVVCIEEANWGFEASVEPTVAHMLRLLEQDGWIEFIHIRVSTSSQLEAAIQRWALHQPQRLKLVYLSLHGAPGGVEVGGEEVPLKDLAAWMPSKGRNRIFHLGACEVLADASACRQFVLQTGARALCGYKTKVGWLAPVAFELLLIAAVANEPRHSAALALEDVKRNVTALARPLGFSVYHHPDSDAYDPSSRAPLPGL